MNNDSPQLIDVVCAVLIDDQRRLLVARRTFDKALGGHWEFPGGKVEAGESLVSAMVREIKEELGTDVVVDETASSSFAPVDHSAAGNGLVIRLHPMVCSLARGAAPAVALEHLAIDWIPLDDEAALDAIDWAPGDRRILAQVLEWCGRTTY